MHDLLWFLRMHNVLRLLLCASLAPAAFAADTNITAIFGGGNPDTGWTAVTSNNIQLGLRAKGRNLTPYAGTVPSDGNGTYTFATQIGIRGPFNYEFSINADKGGLGGLSLLSYDFYIAVDHDSSQGISYSLANPLTQWLDNSFGNNSTTNGNGVEPVTLADVGSFPALFTIAQNSQNITFGGATGYPGGPIPLEANATYTYELFAVASGAGADGARLASTSMTVVIGAGGAAVPDATSTMALVGLALAGLVGLRRRVQS